MVHLLLVAERVRGLFGEDSARAAANRNETDPNAGLQQTFFPEMETAQQPTRPRRGTKAVLDGEAVL